MNKKKNKCGVRLFLSLCAAIGWWGLLYPELTLLPETVRILEIDEDACVRNVPYEWSFDNHLYMKLINAGSDKIIFRSKLLTDFGLFWEALQNGNK